MIRHNGMRHLALTVRDVNRSKAFYECVFGMKVVWQPDPENAYLSSGCDNLALHHGDGGDPAAQRLDHLGFIVPTIPDIEAAWQWAQAEHLEIAKELKHHRDGSVSFYVRDPDGNVVQVLYEPSISPQRIV